MVNGFKKGDGTTNKGVNTSSSLVPIHLDLETESTTSTTTNSKSLGQVKRELQSVIAAMGPDTSYCCTHNVSSDADNEDSTLSCLLPSEEFKTEYTYCTEKTVSSLTTPRENIASRNASPPVLTDVMSTQTNVMDPSSFNMFHQGAVGPPHICLNPACMCFHMPPTGMTQNLSNTDGLRNATRSISATRKKGLVERIKELSFDRLHRSKLPGEFYKINITREDDHSPPRKLVFDLVDGIPKPESTSVATNTKTLNVARKTSSNNYGPYLEEQQSQLVQDVSFQMDTNRKKNEKKNRDGSFKPLKFNMSAQRTTYHDANGDTRVDFYYFDHGNAQYFHTTDAPPIMMCDVIAEKTERYTTKFWAEIFTTIHVAFAFFTSFFLQLFRFALYSIVRPLTVGLMQLASDYFFKPCLTTTFNGIVQPILIFAYNVATSLRDLCDPIAEGMGYFFREFAVLLRAIRFISIKRTEYRNPCV